MAGQITCITKPDPHNSHEAITHVGGVRANGMFEDLVKKAKAGAAEAIRGQLREETRPLVQSG